MNQDEVDMKKDLLKTLMQQMSDVDAARMYPVQAKEEIIESAPDKEMQDDINNDKADLASAMAQDDKMPMVKERPAKKKGKSMGMQGQSLKDQLMAFKK